jgi:ABC-type nitrate/sulfonate/bicarbonate transport system ATPase subunit
MAAMLSLDEVSKSYVQGSSRVDALHNVSFGMAHHECVAIIGPSGAGKSTILRLVAGLEKPSSGALFFAGKAIRGPGRDRSLVFQEHRLMPWLRVVDNVAFGLARDTPNRTELVQRFIELVGLAGFERAYPHQLSGGMAQRAALARALVSRPDLLLLDEPFGALDSLTRAAMQEELARLRQVNDQLMLLVTHDIEEAVFLADRVIIMSPRPGTVRAMVTIALCRPRDRTSPAFLAMKNRILALLGHGAARLRAAVGS